MRARPRCARLLHRDAQQRQPGLVVLVDGHDDVHTRGTRLHVRRMLLQHWQHLSSVCAGNDDDDDECVVVFVSVCVCVSSLMFCISCSDEDGDDDEERTHNTVDHRDIDSGADDNHCDEHLDSGANICADRCADASAHASRHDDDDDDCASDARTNAAAVRRLVPRDVVFLRYRRRSVIGEPTTAAMRQHQRR